MTACAIGAAACAIGAATAAAAATAATAVPQNAQNLLPSVIDAPHFEQNLAIIAIPPISCILIAHKNYTL